MNPKFSRLALAALCCFTTADSAAAQDDGYVLPFPRTTQGGRGEAKLTAGFEVARKVIPLGRVIRCHRKCFSARPLPVLSLAGTLDLMTEVTRILRAIDAGNPHAAAQLLPLVYDELRKLAAGHVANEAPNQTLNATALVHEAHVRLVGPVGDRSFANRGHFFAAAAEAMRRILVDSARRKQALKRGGGPGPAPVEVERLRAPIMDADSWIDLDDALTAFERLDSSAAELAKLRIFAGLSVEEAAAALGMSRATAFRAWTYAIAWLTAALADGPEDP
jgi:RNA polymerase sigma factor (TIGR02999 family)